MNRRHLLKTGTLGTIGFAFGGCATRTPRPAAAAAGSTTRRRIRITPLRVAPELIIRTTVGLRPHRPHGFMLRPEKLGEKLLVHNYGHGGAGWSLSWGTGTMAAEMVREAGHQRAAVLGCGIVGITCARLLQKRGIRTTIYTAAVPPDTTSNMAEAAFTPTSGLLDFSQRTPEWEAQFREAVQISYRQWQLLAQPNMGVSWVDNYSPTENAEPRGGGISILPESVQGERTVLGPGEHNFGSTYVVHRREMRFEPNVALDALLRDFMIFGGRLEIRRFASKDQLATLEEPAIVNCTGLGSKDLMGDTEIMPLKGQLHVLAPQEGVDYSTTGGLKVDLESPGGFLYMMPRRDGIVLGGTSESNIWTMEPNDQERERILRRHTELFASMKSTT
ncbi:MAG TPA: FAD-dependent oxidoreductase [Vicinamibacterales bacterium]|nr:FAD-dependent oxidoreductase [Vicinamibacterales bacterium]